MVGSSTNWTSFQGDFCAFKVLLKVKVHIFGFVKVLNIFGGA